MTRLRLIAVFSALAAGPLAPVRAQNLLWTRQSGTPAYDYAYGVAVDGAGNAYIAGTTYGSLGGPNEGSSDIFLAKYDASGAVLWTRQVGTPDGDEGYAVAVDGAGNAYVVGTTYDAFGGPYAGNGDVFLAKFEALGDLLWVRQIGTPSEEFISGVAVDTVGNAYIAGATLGDLGGPNADRTLSTADAFLAKYSASGTRLWTRQAGTPVDDFAFGVTVDGAGDVLVTGSTLGDFAGPNTGSYDLFLAKYNASGTRLWSRQAGTPASEGGNGVGVDDAGSAYIAGSTTGSLGGPNAGAVDAFLTKYDASGAVLWTRQIGTIANDYGTAVAVDRAGHACITGATTGSLGGPNAGGDDAFLAKYDAAGFLLWSRQAGTSVADWSYAVAVDGAGRASIAGFTEGNLGGSNAGLADAFLAKYGPPPCPADFNGDGFVSGDDFDQYVAAFETGDPSADFNGDGFVSGDDFDAFVAAFESGC